MPPITLATTLLLDRLAFPEAPRWRDDRLWFSDMYDARVMTVTLAGESDIVAAVPQQPFGLGWLPDGRLLVVSMHDRRLLRLETGGLQEVADLSDLAHCHCNDMVVDGEGRAYVGNFGFDYAARAPVRSTVLILITPDGDKRVVADDLMFPNGMAITADGRRLIVAETWGNRLTVFSIGAEGTLSERRVWAQLDGKTPDGICLDAESAVWVASPATREVLRMREGGTITHRIATQQPTLACMLGGSDRRTLFVLSAPLTTADKGRAKRLGRIETTHVEIPGAGLP